MKNQIFISVVLCVVMFLIQNCTSDDVTDGNNILPQGDRPVVTITDSIQINAYTEFISNAESSNTYYLLLGNLNDPILGKTNASFVAQFSNTSYGKYTEGTVCDSVVLTLGMLENAKRFYGDSTTTVKVEVYKLTSPVSSDSTYYSDFDVSGIVDNTPIGTAEFVPASCDTCVRILLSTDYGNQIIESSLNETFDDNIYGLYIKCSDDNTGSCLMRFYASKTVSNYTEYVVYHHIPNEETESNNVTYSISSVDVTFGMVSHDYTNSQLKNLDSNTQEEYVYLQLPVGTCLRLELPGLKQLAESISDKYFTITSAKLIAPIADQSFSSEEIYSPLKDYISYGKAKGTDYSIYFKEFLTTNSSTTSSSTSISVFSYNSTDRCYYLNLTERVIDIINSYKNGSEPIYDIYIYPNGLMGEFARSVICSPTHSDNPMKLVVEYYTFNQ